jgi:hypothetical protein
MSTLSVSDLLVTSEEELNLRRLTKEFDVSKIVEKINNHAKGGRYQLKLDMKGRKNRPGYFARSRIESFTGEKIQVYQRIPLEIDWDIDLHLSHNGGYIEIAETKDEEEDGATSNYFGLRIRHGLELRNENVPVILPPFRLQITKNYGWGTLEIKRKSTTPWGRTLDTHVLPDRIFLER